MCAFIFVERSQSRHSTLTPGTKLVFSSQNLIFSLSDPSDVSAHINTAELDLYRSAPHHDLVMDVTFLLVSEKEHPIHTHCVQRETPDTHTHTLTHSHTRVIILLALVEDNSAFQSFSVVYSKIQPWNDHLMLRVCTFMISNNQSFR